MAEPQENPQQKPADKPQAAPAGKPHRRRFLRGHFVLAAMAVGVGIGAAVNYVNTGTLLGDGALKNGPTNEEIIFSPATEQVRNKPIYGDMEHEFNPYVRHHEMMQDTANVAALKKWLSTLDPLMDKGPKEKLEGLRHLVQDSVKYAYEDRLYGRRDYMAAPLQTARAKYGDCDDFAMLYYIGALYLKFPQEKCFVMMVNSNGEHSLNHAIAVVDTSAVGSPPYQSQNMFILDNGGPLLHLEEAGFTPLVITNRHETHLVLKGIRKNIEHEQSDMKEMGVKEYIKSRLNMIKPKTQVNKSTP